VSGAPSKSMNNTDASVGNSSIKTTILERASGLSMRVTGNSAACLCQYHLGNWETDLIYSPNIAAMLARPSCQRRA
jgi:hypothetical protein